jgi:hypothetical protein
MVAEVRRPSGKSRALKDLAKKIARKLARESKLVLLRELVPSSLTFLRSWMFAGGTDGTATANLGRKIHNR